MPLPLPVSKYGYVFFLAGWPCLGLKQSLGLYRGETEDTEKGTYHLPKFWTAAHQAEYKKFWTALLDKYDSIHVFLR